MKLILCLLFLTGCSTVDYESFHSGCRTGLVFAYSDQLNEQNTWYPSEHYIIQMCNRAEEHYKGYGEK